MMRFGRRRSVAAGLAVAPLLALAMAGSGASSARAAGDPAPPPIATVPAGSSTTGPLIGVSADDGAMIVSQKWVDDRTVDIGIASPAVGVTLPVRVMVPRGWTQTSATSWPSVILLHGGRDNYTAWSAGTDVEALSANWPVLVAMPEGGQSAAYTDYFQKQTPPLQWETFHTKELLQILHRGFRASSKRAIGGVSAGGYGAMDYAARHRGVFTFAASYSGALAIRNPLLTLGIIANEAQAGAAFARYGNPVDDAKNWQAHDPNLLTRNLRGTSLYVSSGFNPLNGPEDMLNLTGEQVLETPVGIMAEAFVARLVSQNISVTTHFTLLGSHNWSSWTKELDRSWPQMMAALGAVKR
jgi:S-formylglutathione hydrolase FrmB